MIPKLDRPTWFNYRSWSDHPHIEQQAEVLLAEMLASRKRQPSTRDRQKLLRAMKTALAGLQLAGAYQRKDVYVPLNRNLYAGKTRRSPMYRPELLKCLQWLIKADYLVRTKNHSYSTDLQQSHPAAYQLTRKWLDMAVQYPPPVNREIVRGRDADFIELRDENRQVIRQEIHPELWLWEKKLKAYDRRLRRYRFEYQGQELPPALFSLTRIFNNGSYDLGGRFYCDFQQWPAKQRLQLTIDGESVIEVDYKGLHPWLLYLRVGAAMPEDAYAVEGFDRKTVKRAFLVLVNSSRTSERWRSLCYELGMKKESAQDLEDRLVALHQPIAHFFGTGIGLELQRHDSALCEAIIDYMVVEADSIVLPIHDSFIVRVSDLEHLAEAMRYAEVVTARKYDLQIASPGVEIEVMGLTPEVNELVEAAFPGVKDSPWLRDIDEENESNEDSS